MPGISCEENVIGRIVIHYPDGSAATMYLRDGQTLSVGTDDLSDICTSDDTVAPTHCVLSINSGVVSIRDCYSAAGTFVDEKAIRETELTHDVEIRVGATRLSLTLNNPVEPETPATSELRVEEPVALPEPEPKSEPVAEDSESDTTESTTAAPSPFQTIDELQHELAQSKAEILVLETRLVDALSAPSASADDPYESEMIQLLQAEVIELQTALAEKEQAVSPTSDVTDHEDLLPAEEAENLVSRLEQLLAELEERDEQIGTLTDLLNSAEETSRAEKEERDQIDGWLGELEDRFGSREREWQAEREQLQQALAAMTEERNRAELAVNADTSNAKLEACQNIMTGLREAAEQQRQQLKVSEETIADLRRQLDTAATSQTREDQMQLAEEKAELARQRMELESARKRAQEVREDDATLKMQAFRKHLNEIHEKEQKEKEERKLSNRIARLWRKLDG